MSNQQKEGRMYLKSSRVQLKSITGFQIYVKAKASVLAENCNCCSSGQCDPIMIFAGVTTVWQKKHKDVKIGKHMKLNAWFTTDAEVP